MNTSSKSRAIRKIARRLSERDTFVWYCMDHTKRDPVAVSENDIRRYMRLGFKVACCFYNGKQHKNAFWDSDLGKYRFTESR